MKNKLTRGYTLIELVISVGLFAIIMTLASGAYLVMIGINRQAQGIATGVDNLSFAIESMARTIRTGINYSCNTDISTGGGADCSGGTSFFVTNANGTRMGYSVSGGAIVQNGIAITDPLVKISYLRFYASGTGNSDDLQPRVTIVVSGSIPVGPGKPDEKFVIQTGATMRGSDI